MKRLWNDKIFFKKIFYRRKYLKKTRLQVKQLAIVENKEEKSEAEDIKPQESDSPAVNEDIQTSEEKIPEGQQAWQRRKN